MGSVHRTLPANAPRAVLEAQIHKLFSSHAFKPVKDSEKIVSIPHLELGPSKDIGRGELLGAIELAPHKVITVL